MPHIAQSQNSPEVQIASEGVQLATEVELHEGFDKLPTATPVHEELEEAQEVFTGRVQCVESSQSSIQRRRVGGEPTIAQSPGWKIFCGFFFMGGIAIATASITLVNAWGNSPFIQLPTSQPTPFDAMFPTAFPNSVYTPTKDPTSCTTVFSAAGENMRISECTEAGCDGSILWCDLIDEINYRLVVSVRGHYGGKKKRITLEMNGVAIAYSPAHRCSGSLETIYDGNAKSSSGSILLSYENSPAVNPLYCRAANVFQASLLLP